MSYDIWTECPVAHECGCTSIDHGWNYTSNCSGMWRKAMPDTDGLAGLEGLTGGVAALAIREGLVEMTKNPDAYRAMNPDNGWGDFDSQFEALGELASQLERAQTAIVRISR